MEGFSGMDNTRVGYEYSYIHVVKVREPKSRSYLLRGF